MAPYRHYDSDSEDSGDEDIVLVTNSVPVNIETADTYTCTHCIGKDAVFKSYNALIEHKAHRQTAGAMCPKCHESFSTQSGLLQHIEGNLCPGGLRRGDVHSAISTHQLLTNETLRREAEGGARELFPRDQEQKSSDLIDSFSHFKIYDKREGYEPLPDDTRMEAKPEWYDRITRMWHCPFRPCTKKYPQQHSFEQHLNSGAHSTKSFLCPGCKKKFPSSSAMLQHVESGMCRITRMSDLQLVKDGLTMRLEKGAKGNSQNATTLQNVTSQIAASHKASESTLESYSEDEGSDVDSDYRNRPLSTIGS
ncbi:hypothetical protein ABW21_db0203251 [Orbilia brochopaga]|nr:hypothetical protein ABW21_db0203251 [Drechslerella brochopaga]